MPDVPSGSDVRNVGMDSLADGAVFGVGTGIGGQVAGPVGSGLGGIVAGASVGGNKGETLATLAVSDTIQSVLMQGGSTGSQSRGVK